LRAGRGGGLGRIEPLTAPERPAQHGTAAARSGQPRGLEMRGESVRAVAYFAALLRRSADRWQARDADLDEIEDIAGLVELMREVPDDEEDEEEPDTTVLLLEQEEVWFAVVPYSVVAVPVMRPPAARRRRRAARCTAR